MNAKDTITLIARNGHTPVHQLLVRTTRPTQTTFTNLVLPAGTVGKVLEYKRKSGILIDFGLLSVVLLPADSPLIEPVGGAG